MGELVWYSNYMNTPKAGKKYRHYKGNEYTIVCLAIDEATEVPVVVYQDIHSPEKIWVRALEMFLEDIEVEGVLKPRFAYFE